MPNPLFKQRQLGVVMIITLISLTILLLASVALVRSTDTSLLMAGSIGFKKDVINQAERAVPVIRNSILSGALSTSTARESDLQSANYYSTVQSNNSAGIPTIILDTSAFDAKYGANNITDAGSQITVRYIVDRLCSKTGAVDAAYCSLSRSTTDPGGDANNLMACGDSNCSERSTGLDVPVYRLTVRATGPRNVETFMQYTFTQ